MNLQFKVAFIHNKFIRYLKHLFFISNEAQASTLKVITIFKFLRVQGCLADA